MTARASRTTRFEVTLSIVIRPCRAGDLAGLEWHGAFSHHRHIARRAWRRHREGTNVMLVADARGYPAGQVWIDLERPGNGAGLLWALRVHPLVRSYGIGSRLIARAEDVLRRRGYDTAEVGVEVGNEDARRLYERLGYRRDRKVVESYAYTTPDDVTVDSVVHLWMLRKPLQPGRRSR